MDCSAQTMDPHLVDRVLCAKYGPALNRYMHNGGSALCIIHRLSASVLCTKHGYASGMQRRVTILSCSY